MPYQVLDWGMHYENSRSRGITHPSWCPVPNKQDGLSYRRLVRENPVHYAVFVAIVLALSKQINGATRNGWLTTDGTPTGTAWDEHDIADKTGISAEIIKAALNDLCSDRIKWLHLVKSEDVNKVQPQSQPPQNSGKKERVNKL